MSGADSSRFLNFLTLHSAVRFVIYGLSFGVALFRFKYDLFSYTPDPVIVLTLALFCASLLGLVVGLTRCPAAVKRLLLNAAFVIDIACITAIVHFSGGVESRAAYLYALPLLLSVSASFRAAMVVSFGILASYTTLIGLENAGVLQSVVLGEYTPSQSAIVHVLRIGIFEAVLLLGGTLALLFSSRRAYRFLQSQEDAFYETTHLLRTQLERTQDALAERGLTDLSVEISQTLARADAVHTELPEAAAPMRRKRNLLRSLECSRCRASIPPLARYWAHSVWDRTVRGYGTYRNDIHCVSCHEAGESCAMCLV